MRFPTHAVEQSDLSHSNKAHLQMSLAKGTGQISPLFLLQKVPNFFFLSTDLLTTEITDSINQLEKFLSTHLAQLETLLSLTEQLEKEKIASSFKIKFRFGSTAPAGRGYKNLSRVKSDISTNPAIYQHHQQSKVRSEDQIPVTTFWTAVDGFFAPIAESDLQLLRPASIDEALFLIAPAKDLGSVACKTNNLSARIVTMLLDENLKPHQLTPLSGDISAAETLDVQEVFLHQLSSLKERLIRELCFLSIPIDRSSLLEVGKQSVCNDDGYSELRCLQYELRQVNAVNNQRKKRLLKHLTQVMASAEYYSIVDELDRQIESSYLKKYKSIKKKKRNAPVDLNADFGGPDLSLLLGKRRSVIDSFSSFVLPRLSLTEPLGEFRSEAEETEIEDRYVIPILHDSAAKSRLGITELHSRSTFLLWPTVSEE